MTNKQRKLDTGQTADVSKCKHVTNGHIWERGLRRSATLVIKGYKFGKSRSIILRISAAVIPIGESLIRNPSKIN